MQLVETIRVRPKEDGVPRELAFCIGNEAMRELEVVSGRAAWSILADQVESYTRIAHLAYCGLAVTIRQLPKYQGMTLSQCEAEILPLYMSDEWFQFQDAINDLVRRTFPRAAGTRQELQTLQAAQILSSLANVFEKLTGTNESTSPATSSTSPVENSSSNGTG